MELPEFLEKKCTDEIIQYEEAMTVPYVSPAERLGIKKGKAEGLEEGLEKGRMEEKRDMAKRLI